MLIIKEINMYYSSGLIKSHIFPGIAIRLMPITNITQFSIWLHPDKPLLVFMAQSLWLQSYPEYENEINYPASQHNSLLSKKIGSCSACNLINLVE
jgi:hypothetical protein